MNQNQVIILPKLPARKLKRGELKIILSRRLIVERNTKEYNNTSAQNLADEFQTSFGYVHSVIRELKQENKID